MPDTSPALAGRVAIVTGGGSGIGEQTAKMLAARGANVILVSDRPTSETDIVRDAIRGLGGQAESRQCDVGDEAAVGALVAAVLGDLGRIDILVNSAGMFRMAPIAESPAAEAERVMRVNYIGTYNMIRAVLPGMKAAGRGAIVNVASMAASFSSPMSTAYAASKGAVVAFTRSLVTELARSGIRVNTVMPGGVRTAMTAAFHSPEDEAGQAVLAMVESRAVSPRGMLFAEPEEIAEVIVFLASDAARAVHGASIQVDEGVSSASF